MRSERSEKLHLMAFQTGNPANPTTLIYRLGGNRGDGSEREGIKGRMLQSRSFFLAVCFVSLIRTLNVLPRLQ